jgi:hypothetical protein
VASKARRNLQVGGAVALGLLLGSAAIPRPAAAGNITSEALLQQSTLVVNQQSNVYAFTAPGPGTLTVFLDDIAWPTQLESLTASIDAPGVVLGSMSTGGYLPVQVANAGTYYADVTGLAGGPLDIGVYSLQVDWYAENTPVPLPEALGLLLGGLVMLCAAALVLRGGAMKASCTPLSMTTH